MRSASRVRVYLHTQLGEENVKVNEQLQRRARAWSILAIMASIAMLLTFVAVPSAAADLSPGSDAQTVYDSTLHVTWLANANLAGSSDGQFGVPGINPSGSMSYATAQAWVEALNASNYLGHDDWTLPVTPPSDPTCSTRGTHQERFGVGCTESALGNLYSGASSLHLSYPNTAVSIAPNTVGPFTNFQPYLYWSDTTAGSKGWQSFSFANGFQGANTDNHVMYVLPMFQGPPPGTNFVACGQSSSCGLQPTPDGSLVYDPVTNVTWLADADLAATMSIPCEGCTINPDGSMTHSSAEAFKDAMNSYNGGTGWLGVNAWLLPPTVDGDSSCSLGKNTRSTFGFDCTGSPMGELYYNQLSGGLSPGTPVIATSDASVGPFANLQPYLYWSCQQSSEDPVACGGAPAEDFQWSFSFGNGFQGTDVVQNNLYVMVYYPDRQQPMAIPTPRIQPVPTVCRGGKPGEPSRCV